MTHKEWGDELPYISVKDRAWEMYADWTADRRAPADDLLRELRDELKEAAQRLFGIMPLEDHGIVALLNRIERLIPRADAHLEGREPQNYSAALREAFVAGARDETSFVGKKWDMYANSRAEAEALRRWPEPPKEGGR